MISPNDLTPSDYNPRAFSDKALKGLKKSVKDFSDISGITWNKQTKNIVTGHHRWKILCDLYDIKNLKFEQIGSTDKYIILNKKKDTGYILRVVDWDIVKEKAANVLANSHAIEGTFTDNLQDVLSDIKFSMPELEFEELNLSDLEIPKMVESKKEEDTKESKKKSETMVSSGGEKYRTVKLEISPELSERLRVQLERFKTASADSVETPLDIILNFLENTEDDTVFNMFKKKTVKEVKKRRRG